MLKVIDGGVTAPKGFKASGIEAEIKKKNKKDIALIYSEVPATAAGTFTTNRVKAAPVLVDIDTVKKGKGQAIIANSGNANACNGKKGITDAKKMQTETAKALKIKSDLVYVASTGVIGQTLPMDKVVKGISKAVKSLHHEGNDDAASAIMTTDTFPKSISVEFELDGKTCRMGAICKGSGMIAPLMAGPHATMLCFITTDANVDQKLLQKMIETSVDRSFNHVTVDNDESTNDTCIIFANGLAGNKTLKSKSSQDYAVFLEALQFVTTTLAKMMARDGEGATKFVEVIVENAKTEKDAFVIAKAIANSPLVKTAIFGADANWGRIICAAGYSGVKINPDVVDITLGGKSKDEEDFELIKLARNGISTNFPESDAKKLLENSDILILVDIKEGSQSSYVWTCDFSYDYVKINGSYRS